MKKTFLLLAVLVLSIFSVSAFHDGKVDVEQARLKLVGEGLSDEQATTALEVWEGLDTDEQHKLIRKCLSNDNVLECAGRNIDDEKLDEIVDDVREKGLENALTVVKNEVARDRIERNIIRKQERNGIVYDMVIVSEDVDTVIVAGERTRKLFFIPITGKHYTVYDEDGLVVKESENFGSKVLKLFGR